MNRWPGNYEGLVQLPRLGRSGAIGGGAGPIETPVGAILSIVGYFDGIIPNPFQDFGTLPVWDGKFPVFIVEDNLITWQGFLHQGSEQIDHGQVCTCQIQTSDSVEWTMRIGSDGDFGSLWVGTSSTVTGVYTNTAGQSPVPPAPATLTVAIVPGDRLSGGRISCSS